MKFPAVLNIHMWRIAEVLNYETAPTSVELVCLKDKDGGTKDWKYWKQGIIPVLQMTSLLHNSVTTNRTSVIATLLNYVRVRVRWLNCDII